MNRVLKILVAQAFLIVGGLAVLEGVVRWGWIDPRLLPPPTVIFATLGSLVLAGKFGGHVWITFLEVMTAFLISAPLGIMVGLLLAKHVYFGGVFGSFVYFLVSIPKSIFLPIFILALGVGFDQKVVFGIAQAFFVIAINTATAVGSVPRNLVLLGRSCGASTWQLYTRIYIPAMIPIILEGIRLGMIFIITGVILAEMYAAREGLGWLISAWTDTFNMPNLFAGIIVATIISIVVNEAIRLYEKRVSRWRA